MGQHLRNLDVAYVERDQTGSLVESFCIENLDSAINQAANLTAYHNEKFNVVIKNEKTFKRPAKLIEREKSSKSVKPNVFHVCALTETRSKHV